MIIRMSYFPLYMCCFCSFLWNVSMCLKNVSLSLFVTSLGFWPIWLTDVVFQSTKSNLRFLAQALVGQPIYPSGRRSRCNWYFNCESSLSFSFQLLPFSQKPLKSLQLGWQKFFFKFPKVKSYLDLTFWKVFLVIILISCHFLLSSYRFCYFDLFSNHFENAY